MNRSDYEKLLAYVSPYYDEKDILHGIEHIERLLYSAKEIIEAEDLKIDFSLVIYGAYFHGLASHDLKEIENYLSENNLDPCISQIAKESLGKTNAVTVEGQVLSDAHVLEGGTFLRYLKPLLTGTYMHQPLDDTLSFIEKNLLDQGHVYFDSSRVKLDLINREIRGMHSSIKSEFHKRYTIDF